MICYVDDLRHIGFKPKEYMNALNIIYRLNYGFGPPDRYLGANFDQVQFKDGQFIWSTNCVDYLKREIENVDNSLGVDKAALNNYGVGNRPYSSSFGPELDVNEELGEELTNRYQQLIGVLRWSIELGNINILTEKCFYLNTCVPQDRDTLMLFILSSDIYRRTWVRTQGI